MALKFVSASDYVPRLGGKKLSILRAIRGGKDAVMPIYYATRIKRTELLKALAWLHDKGYIYCIFPMKPSGVRLLSHGPITPIRLTEKGTGYSRNN